MKIFVKIVQRVLVVSISFTIVDCASVNRLRDYQFKEHTAASFMMTPPRPEIFTDSNVWIDTNDPIGTVLRVGTTIAKEVEAQKAQARMDIAMEQIDVPNRIKERTLQRCGKILHYRPIEDSDQADYLMNMEIHNYGIEAKSWTAGTYFKIDVLVQILDNQTGALVWKRRIKEKQPISAEIFGLGRAVENVISAAVLSNLSTDEIANGFQHLADYTADQITARLQKDLAKAQGRG